MKTIKCTKIDTGSHGYLSVSKKDIILSGLDVNKISGYSGHTLNRVYLEEDCDASLFYDTCESKGIEIKVKYSYNLRFNITHNYNPKLFNYSPKINDIIIANDDRSYKIIYKDNKKIIVNDIIAKKNYSIPLNSIFKYLKDIS
jgi:hypothetical protein